MEEDKKTYAVIYLLSPDKSRVLLQKKDRTDMAGKWNGVGGKFEEEDRCVQCTAIRETFEETGVRLKPEQLHLVCHLETPCDETGRNGIADLWFFCACIGETDVNPPESATEQLTWFPVDEIMGKHPLDCGLAGHGDIQMNLALILDNKVTV